jgi:hypothetical protein
MRAPVWMLGCVRAGAPSPRRCADGFLSHLRTVKPVRGVNVDSGGRPDGNFHPKTSVMTSLVAGT